LSPLQWRHEYKAKRICELLYLIDSDFYENVENYRMFRAVLEAQDAVQEEEDDCETETDMGLKAAPAASDGSTVLAASSSTAGDYGAPPPVSVPEGDVLDNRSSSDQQSSDPKRDLLSPTLNMASVVAAAGKKAAKSVSLTGKQGAGANKDAASIADKWGGKKPGSKATAGAKVPQAQLDEQLLRQKIETEARPARPTLPRDAAAATPGPTRKLTRRGSALCLGRCLGCRCAARTRSRTLTYSHSSARELRAPCPLAPPPLPPPPLVRARPRKRPYRRLRRGRRGRVQK
jgi:hypothetical protein